MEGNPGSVWQASPREGDAIAITLHGLEESQELICYYLLSTSLYHERKMNFHHGILQWVYSVLVVTLGMLDPKRVMFGWWLEFMATAPFPYRDRQAWGLWLLLTEIEGIVVLVGLMGLRWVLEYPSEGGVLFSVYVDGKRWNKV